MIILDEYRLRVVQQKKDIEELGRALNIEQIKKRLGELDEASSAPDFWDDMEKAQKILAEQKILKEKSEKYKALCTLADDTAVLIEMAMEDSDETLEKEIVDSVNAIETDIKSQTLETLLDGEYDGSNAILTFHAGAGGTEAQDWALMLFRMYSRFGEKHNYKVKVMDYLDGDEAGLKSAVLLIEGPNAYGYLKSETGVHRLVRISPFDASGRRHTSFASVEVMPEIDDETHKVEIREEDIKVEAHRASGAGGQHINKTDSAIRITHIPTGIVVG